MNNREEHPGRAMNAVIRPFGRNWSLCATALVMLTLSKVVMAQTPQFYPPIYDFKSGTVLTLGSADGERIAQLPPTPDEVDPLTEPTPTENTPTESPPEILPSQPAAISAPASTSDSPQTVTTPAASLPGPSRPAAPAPAAPTPATAVPGTDAIPSGLPDVGTTPLTAPLYDHTPPLVIESPVARMFRDLTQQLGDSQKREAEQFDSMLQRLQRIQDNFAHQQRILELQREMQQARDAAMAKLLAEQANRTSSEPAPTNDREPTTANTATDVASSSPPVESDIPDEPSQPPEPVAISSQEPSTDPTVAVDTGPTVDENSENPSVSEEAGAGADESLPKNALELTSTVDRVALADNLFAAGRYELAGPIYEGLLLEAMPAEEEVWIRYQVATCYRAVGDLPNARKHFLVIVGTKGVDNYSKMATWWLDHLNQQERLRERVRALRNEVSEIRAGENQ